MVVYDEKLKYKVDVHNPKAKSSKMKSKWWASSTEDLPNSVIADIEQMYTNYSYFFRERYINEGVYLSKSPQWFGNALTGSRYNDFNRLNKNCTASAVDTLTSMVARQDIGVSVMTTDGDYNLQKQAEDLGRYLDGIFLKEDLRSKMRAAHVDCCINFNGVIKLLERSDYCVGYEHYKPYEVVMNPDDCFHGDPESLHLVRMRNRYELAKEFPEYVKEIMEATGDFSWFMWERMNRMDDDMVLTVESFSRFAERHSFCVSSACLFDKELKLKNAYGETAFPIAVLKYKSSGRKWWGVGGVEQVRTMQWALDSTYRDMEIMKKYTLVPRLLMPRTAAIEKNFINNDVRLPIIDYSGTQEPNLLQVEIPPDVWRFMQTHEEGIYSVFGVSSLMAQSEKPSGLDSGKALDSFYDIQNDRFEDHGKCWTDFMEEIADLTIRYQATFEHADEAYTFYVGKNIKRQIKFSDVNLSNECFQVQKRAVSDIPKSMEGKIQMTQWLMSTQMMDKTTAMELFQIPDVDQALDRQNAPIKYILKQMCDIADGEDVLFETWQDPTLCTKVGWECYAHFSLHGLAPDRLTAIKKFLMSIEKEMLQKQTQMSIISNEMMRDQQQALASRQGTNPSFGTASGKAISPEPSAITQQMAMGAMST